MMYILYAIAFTVALLMTLLMTPIVRRFAFVVGAVDAPNHRKVHSRIMPRLGGLAIFLGFAVAFFMISPLFSEFKSEAAWSILIGGAIIVLTGALDDRFELSPKWKLLGQFAAAFVVVGFGLKVEFINLPFSDVLYTNNLGWLSIPLTVLWIVGVTNAVNLIDGLDGLAAGVSGISTATITVLAFMMGNETVILLSLILLGNVLGFLVFNFHPAKIFMGDSGALFLGFSLAVFSMLGFKQATLVSFVVPMLILAVPLSDTFFAIVRRKVFNKSPMSVADKNHLHHCIMQRGYSHRDAVLFIYGIAAVFGAIAILLSQTSQWVTVLLIAFLIVATELGAEFIGIFGFRKKPVLRFLKRARISTLRFLAKTFQ